MDRFAIRKAEIIAANRKKQLSIATIKKIVNCFFEIRTNKAKWKDEKKQIIFSIEIKFLN